MSGGDGKGHNSGAHDSGGSIMELRGKVDLILVADIGTTIHILQSPVDGK
ncbi:Uncharacterised protein [Hafnia alvei]|nr:Uncharacterised protein [Hafnia alvei]